MPEGLQLDGVARRVRGAREINALYMLFHGRPTEGTNVREESFGRTVLDIAEMLISSVEFRERVLDRFLAEGTLPHDKLCLADLRQTIETAGETGLAVFAPSDFGPEIHFAVDLEPLEGAAFIAAAYRMILGREPDADGFESYLERLRIGAASKQEIAAELLSSEEFHESGCALRLIWDEDGPSGREGATMPFGWRPVLHRIFAAQPVRQIIEQHYGSSGQQFIVGLDPSHPGLILSLGAPSAIGAVTEFSREKRLLIEGWALARDGIADIEIALGGELIGSIRRGLRRADVAAAFPEWPEAWESGFATVLFGEEVPPEIRAVQIILRDKTGKAATAELFLVDSEADTEKRFFCGPKRTEQAALARIVTGSGQGPRFCVMLVAEPSDSSLAAVHRSLAALHNQSYPEWRALIIVRDHGATREMLHQRLLAHDDDHVGLRNLLVGESGDLAALRDRVLDGFGDIAERIDVLTGRGSAALTEMLHRRAGGRSTFAVLLNPGDALDSDALLELAGMSVLDSEAELITSGDEEGEWTLCCISAELLQRTGAILDDLLQIGLGALAEHCSGKTSAATHIPLPLCKPGRERADKRGHHLALGLLPEAGRDIEAEIRILRDSGLFDETFYRANNPDLGLAPDIDLARHFLEFGAREGRKPNRMFDPAYYLRAYPDVAQSDQNPLIHFIYRGVSEGRRPCRFFDPAFYLRQYGDVAQSGMNPLRHYLEQGEAEGRSPAELNYQEWCEFYDTLSGDDRTAIATRLANLAYQPLISLGIVVEDDFAVELLRRVLFSVVRQLYQKWELFIGVQPHLATTVRSVLDGFDRAAGRIEIIDLLPDTDRATAANAVVGRSNGEFIAWIGEQDELAETALYLVIEELNRYRDADVIYSDEDRIEPAGRRHNPHFKPDWNLDLFYGWDYVGNLRVYRISLVRGVGGLRRGFDGALFYDLALRVIELTEADRIRHIPFLLYHRRAAESPMVCVEEERNHAANAARHALSEHFLRTGRPEVEVVPGRLPYHHRVIWPLPSPPPRVSLVIPTNGSRLDVLGKCVSGLLERTDYANFELIILDNTSGQSEALAYFEEISADPRVMIVNARGPFSFAKICNIGVKRATGEVIGLINDDTQVIEAGWLREMVSHALRPVVGAVGAMLYYPNETIQHAGVIFGLRDGTEHVQRFLPRGAPGYFGRALLTQDLSCVTAACLVMRRAVYHEVGGLDERLAVDFNDVDLCINIRSKGYLIVWTPFAELYHLESATRGYLDTLAKIRRIGAETRYIREKWGPEVFSHDPYFNPNLRRDTENFEIGGVPRVAKPWLSEPSRDLMQCQP